MALYTEDVLYQTGLVQMGEAGLSPLNVSQTNLVKDIDSYLGCDQFCQKNKNFLIKIDDDFKVVSNYSFNENFLNKIIKVYYPDSAIEIFKLSAHSDILLSTLTEPTSFLSSNEIDPNEFISKLNMFDTIVNYLNTLDKTSSFISKITTFSKSFDRKEHSTIDAHDGDVRDTQISTRLPVANANHYDLRGSIGLNLVDAPSPVKNGVYYKEHSLLSNPKNASHFNVDGCYDDPTDTDDISGYNFSDTSFMDIARFSESLLDNYVNYNVYFNSQFNTIIITQDIGDFIAHNTKFKNFFPELQLVVSEKLNTTQLSQIKNLNNDIFVNLEDAKSRVNKILNDKIIDSKLSIDEIKGLIKKYFDIDTNPEHCIKFTNIWNIISSEIKVSESFINYIKRQLPGILADLGLNKKRLSDGIYWYGLVKKQLNTSKSTHLTSSNLFTKINDTPVAEETYQKLLVDRENMYNLIKSFAGNDFLNVELELIENEIPSSNDEINKNNEPSKLSEDYIPTAQVLAKSSNIKKITRGFKKTTHIAQTPSDEIKKVIKKK
jgi:hypothetical protein